MSVSLTPDLAPVFSTWAPLTSVAEKLFLVGGVCPTHCGMFSNTHSQMPTAASTLRCDSQKCLQAFLNVPGVGHLPWLRNPALEKWRASLSTAGVRKQAGALNSSGLLEPLDLLFPLLVPVFSLVRCPWKVLLFRAALWTQGNMVQSAPHPGPGEGYLMQARHTLSPQGSSENLGVKAADVRPTPVEHRKHHGRVFNALCQ